MTIYQLTSISTEHFADLQQLMSALSDTPHFTEATLEATLSAPGCHLFAAEADGKLVGCATLCIFASPTGRKASIEDVVVLPEYRGRGIARKLMQELLGKAKSQAPITLQLTSRPHRIAARALYESLGFTPKHTGFYKLTIPPQQ